MRWSFSKDEEYVEVDPVIAEVIAVPAPREGALIDAVATAGGDIGVQKAAAAAARSAAAIVDAFGGELPVDVAKAMDEQFEKAGISAEVRRETEARYRKRGREATDVAEAARNLAGKNRAPGKPLKDGDLAPWHLAELDRMRKERPAEFAGKSDQEMVDALLLEHPEWAADDSVDESASGPDATLRTLQKTAELWRDVARIERESGDAMAERHLKTVAKDLRRRHPGMTMTEAQSIAKALELDPALYEAQRRHELRKAGYDVDADLSVATPQPPPLPYALETAARQLRRADTSLTEAQSIAKALENNPDLYEGGTT